MCQFTFNPVQDGSCGEVQKGSLLVSLNTFWLLVLILFPHSCKILEPCLEPVSNYWTWTKTSPQKDQFSWSNPYEIWVVITSPRGEFRATTTSKFERFVIIVDGKKPWTIIAKCSILDVVAALDPPLALIKLLN